MLSGETRHFVGRKTVYAYHGSPGKLDLPIRHDHPKANPKSDFGAGFYAGTNPQQVRQYMANEANPYFYELSVN